MINKYPSQDNTNNDDIQNKNGIDENTNDDILLKNGGNNNVDETGNARADLAGLNMENVDDTLTTKRHLLITWLVYRFAVQLLNLIDLVLSYCLN